MNRQPSMKKSFTQKLGRLILPTIFSLGFFSARVSQAQIVGGYTNVYWVSTNLWTSGNSALGGTASWNSTGYYWTTNASGATANSNGPVGGGTFFMANGNAGTATANNSGGLIVNFSGTPGTVSQSSAMQVNQVNFLVSGYTWTASGARTLTFTNGINLADGVNTIITATSGNSFTFNGTGVSGGTGSSLTLGLGASSGTAAYTSTIYFNGGTISVPITMNVGGTSNGFAAKFFLGSSSSTGLIINGNITNNSAGPLDLTNSSSGDLVVNGVISGSQGITLGNSSSGKIILTAANTYAGGTTLRSTSTGEIRYSNAASFGPGTITSSGSGTTNYIRALVNDLNLTNAISIDNSNTLQLGATNTGWKAIYSGEISGAGSVLYSYSGFVALSGTNNSFGGGYVMGSSGRSDLSKIGLVGQNSSIGTNGVITAGLITTPSSKPTLRWVGTNNETSDKVINIGNATGGFQLETIGDGDLTLNGNINSSGLGGPKMIYLYPYTNASMVVSGVTNNVTNTLSLNGVINDGTPGYVVNDASVGITKITNVVGGTTNVVTNGVGTITLASVAGLSVGDSISGGNCIAPGTTISAIDTTTKIITLSQITTNTSSLSAGLAVMNVANATAATSLTIQPKSSAGSSYVNVVLGNTNNSFSGPVIFTNSQSGLVSILKVGRLGNAGENSSLGKAGNVTLGGASGATCTLDYTGSGEVSSKTITLGGTLGNVGLSQSGTGLLKLTGGILSGTTTGARKLTFSGSSAGAGELASNLVDPSGFALTVDKNGSGTWTLSGNNTYSGNTTINAGVLRLSGVNSGAGTVTLSSTSSVLQLANTNALLSANLMGVSSSSNTGTVNLEVGGNHSISSYGNSGNAAGNMNFTNSSGVDATLVFTAPTNYIGLSSSTTGGRTLANQSTNLTITFNGAVDIGSSANADVAFGGAGNFNILGTVFNTNTLGVRALTKSGAGTLTLSASNNYNGETKITTGTLLLKAAGALGTNSLILNGGTLKVDVAGTNESKGNLTLSNSSTIDLGTVSEGVLRFVSANSNSWTALKVLTVANSSIGAKLYITDITTVDTNRIKSAENANAVASLATNGLLSFSVPKTNQTITFDALSAKTYGDAGFSLSASASSGLTVSYASSDLSVATVAGNTVTIVGAGTTTITASQAGNDSYNPASSVPQTLTVNKASQTITFAALTAAKVGDPSITLSATASSGLPVSYASSDLSVATVAGNTVTIVGAGTTTITASQAGNGNYDPATSVNQTLTVTSAGPTFDSAYQGRNMSDIAPNGLSYLMNYAFGGSDTTDPKLPVQDTTDPTKLALVAYVRTGDTSLSVSGEAAATLEFGSPSNAPYEVITPSDAPAGMEKRSYSVSVSGDRKFLRLKATKQ